VRQSTYLARLTLRVTYLLTAAAALTVFVS
jgi:hypothetical protein